MNKNLTKTIAQAIVKEFIENLSAHRYTGTLLSSVKIYPSGNNSYTIRIGASVHDLNKIKKIPNIYYTDNGGYAWFINYSGGFDVKNGPYSSHHQNYIENSINNGIRVGTKGVKVSIVSMLPVKIQIMKATQFTSKAILNPRRSK